MIIFILISYYRTREPPEISGKLLNENYLIGDVARFLERE
jgi:hypothetical protein